MSYQHRWAYKLPDFSFHLSVSGIKKSPDLPEGKLK